MSISQFTTKLATITTIYNNELSKYTSVFNQYTNMFMENANVHPQHRRVPDSIALGGACVKSSSSDGIDTYECMMTAFDLQGQCQDQR